MYKEKFKLWIEWFMHYCTVLCKWWRWRWWLWWWRWWRLMTMTMTDDWWICCLLWRWYITSCVTYKLIYSFILMKCTWPTVRFSSHDCSCLLVPRKSFEILVLCKSDYYYYHYYWNDCSDNLPSVVQAIASSLGRVKQWHKVDRNWITEKKHSSLRAGRGFVCNKMK